MYVCRFNILGARDFTDLGLVPSCPSLLITFCMKTEGIFWDYLFQPPFSYIISPNSLPGNQNAVWVMSSLYRYCLFYGGHWLDWTNRHRRYNNYGVWQDCLTYTPNKASCTRCINTYKEQQFTWFLRKCGLE